MSGKVVVSKSKLDNLANAIASKCGTGVELTIDEMEHAVQHLTTEPSLQAKNVSPSSSVQVVNPDPEFDGLSRVTVGAISSNYIGENIERRASTDLTSNGATVTVPAGYYATQAFKSVDTAEHSDPTISLDAQTGTITASHLQTEGYVSADTSSSSMQLTTQIGTTIIPSDTAQIAVASGKYTLGNVNVAAIPPSYIGTGISIKDATDLTASGGTVTVPSGYYVEQYTKSVGNGSATTPQTTISVTPSISINGTGLITASVSESEDIVPEIVSGYISSGTSGRVTASGSATSQLSIQDQATITPSKSTQIAVEALKYTIGDVTVAPIPNEYIVPSGTITIDDNGTVDVTNYATASVQLEIDLQEKTAVPSEAAQVIEPDNGYYGLGAVNVSAISPNYVGSGIARNGSADLTSLGATVTVPAGYYASQATKTVSLASHGDPTLSIDSATGIVTASHVQGSGYVSGDTSTATLQLSTQAGTTINPSEQSQVAVGAGKYTLGGVNVAAIPSDYVGTEIPRKTAADLSANDATVTVPPGYYASVCTKTIPSGSATTPSTTITASPSITVGADGIVTATVSSSQSVTPTVVDGYISQGTAGNVTVTGSDTYQIDTQTAKVVTPSENSQTAVAAGKFTTGAVTVGAIPSNYIGSSVTSRTSNDMTLDTSSGISVKAPSGYYSSEASYSLGTATASISSLSINSQTGVVTASYEVDQDGYIHSTSGSDTLALSTQAAVTITPSSTSQTAVAAGKYTIGAVTVAAMRLEDVTITPSNSVQIVTAGENYDGLGTVTVQAGTVYEPANGVYF